MKPWVQRRWCIPAIDEEFVARMEDILDLYERPLGPGEMKVCVDERPYQLLADIRPPLPMEPGQPAREDYTYERKGACNLFVVLAPDLGWRDVVVTEQRTKEDWGRLLVRLTDEVFPEAQKIHLVCDNLNIHTLGALYLILPPEEARKRAERFVLHPTPKHASWLNMAEIEISALERQCLDRRIGEIETLRREAAAWVQSRNEAQVSVHWRFTSRDARQKLARSYPKIKSG
ncbi:MAG: IS630 family transposase [Candidatus Bathyarchaeia archaeon]